MKAKLLLAALALPLVFTACSQDELENSRNNGNIPSNAIEGLKLSIQKSGESDGIDTRGTWLDGANKISFDKTDKISLYWLGTADETANSYEAATARTEITGKFNSIFRTDNGTDFSSESLVFEGGNIAVYPGDLAFVQEGKLFLNVPDVQQDVSVLNNIPYISNQLWIKKQGENQTEQLPGYYGDKVLDCPVKQAANVVNLKLNLSNIPAGYGFEVQSVELVTKDNENVFTTKSNIITEAGTPNYGGEVLVTAPDTEEKSIVAQTWSKPATGSTKATLTTKNITKVDDETVIAHFVVLPTDALTVTENDAKIVVRTNCGTITLESKEQKQGSTDLKNVVLKSDGEVDGTTGAINEAIKSFVKSQTASETSKFKGEKIGKTFNRSIAVNVAEAKLNGSLVYTSEDIIRYVNLHTAMNSTENPVSLKMTPADATVSAVFAGLTKTAVDKLNVKNANSEIFSLIKGDGLTAIEIVGGGEVFDVKALADNAALPLHLSNETWVMDDKLDVDAGFSSIVNNGTLTIRGTVTNGNQNQIVEVITNKGTINLGGNGTVVVGSVEFKTSESSEINIAASQELQFSAGNNDGDLKGTINVTDVTAKLTATAAITNNGTINNNGIVAGNTTNGWTNKGTINIKDDLAITYVKDNENGVIMLKNRNDEVKVDDSTKNGKIVYNWNDGDTFTQAADDKFTYVVFDGIEKLTVTKTADELEKNTSMEFKGLCSLTAAGVTINDMIVEAGADFRFTSGNKLTVQNLTNKGTITIGGEIVYVTSFNGTAGRVLTTGQGAITQQVTSEP